MPRSNEVAGAGLTSAAHRRIDDDFRQRQAFLEWALVVDALDLSELLFDVSGVRLQLRDERISVSREKRRWSSTGVYRS